MPKDKTEPTPRRGRAWGIGLSFGLAGAAALVARYGFRRSQARPQLPENLSPAIFARRLAPTSHGDMVYHVSGSGEPLLFLHGLYPGASSYEWSRVYPRFVLHREVIAADLPGFGESERTDRVTDASDLAESLADFVRETVPGRTCDIVAGGLSAPIALLVAARHPERISSLTLLEPESPNHPPVWSTPSLRLLSKIPGPPRSAALRALRGRRFFRRFLGTSADDEGALATLVACARQPGARLAPLRILRGGLRFDLKTRLDRIAQPVALVGCGDAPEGFAARMAGSLPGVRYFSLSTARTPLPALFSADAVEEALSEALGLTPPFREVA